MKQSDKKVLSPMRKRPPACKEKAEEAAVIKLTQTPSKRKRGDTFPEVLNRCRSTKCIESHPVFKLVDNLISSTSMTGKAKWKPAPPMNVPSCKSIPGKKGSSRQITIPCAPGPLYCTGGSCGGSKALNKPPLHDKIKTNVCNISSGNNMRVSLKTSCTKIDVNQCHSNCSIVSNSYLTMLKNEITACQSKVSQVPEVKDNYLEQLHDEIAITKCRYLQDTKNIINELKAEILNYRKGMCTPCSPSSDKSELPEKAGKDDPEQDTCCGTAEKSPDESDNTEINIESEESKPEMSSESSTVDKDEDMVVIKPCDCSGESKAAMGESGCENIRQSKSEPETVSTGLCSGIFTPQAKCLQELQAESTSEEPEDADTEDNFEDDLLTEQSKIEEEVRLAACAADCKLNDTVSKSDTEILIPQCLAFEEKLEEATNLIEKVKRALKEIGKGMHSKQEIKKELEGEGVPQNCDNVTNLAAICSFHGKCRAILKRIEAENQKAEKEELVEATEVLRECDCETLMQRIEPLRTESMDMLQSKLNTITETSESEISSADKIAESSEKVPEESVEQEPEEKREQEPLEVEDEQTADLDLIVPAKIERASSPIFTADELEQFFVREPQSLNVLPAADQSEMNKVISSTHDLMPSTRSSIESYQVPINRCLTQTHLFSSTSVSESVYVPPPIIEGVQMLKDFVEEDLASRRVPESAAIAPIERHSGEQSAAGISPHSGVQSEAHSLKSGQVYDKIVREIAEDCQDEMCKKRRAHNLTVQKLPPISIRSGLVIQKTLHLTIEPSGTCTNDIDVSKRNVGYLEFSEAVPNLVNCPVKLRTQIECPKECPAANTCRNQLQLQPAPHPEYVKQIADNTCLQECYAAFPSTDSPSPGCSKTPDTENKQEPPDKQEMQQQIAQQLIQEHITQQLLQHNPAHPDATASSLLCLPPPGDRRYLYPHEDLVKQLQKTSACSLRTYEENDVGDLVKRVGRSFAFTVDQEAADRIMDQDELLMYRSYQILKERRNQQADKSGSHPSIKFDANLFKPLLTESEIRAQLDESFPPDSNHYESSVESRSTTPEKLVESSPGSSGVSSARDSPASTRRPCCGGGALPRPVEKPTVVPVAQVDFAPPAVYKPAPRSPYDFGFYNTQEIQCDEDFKVTSKDRILYARFRPMVLEVPVKDVEPLSLPPSLPPSGPRPVLPKPLPPPPSVRPPLPKPLPKPALKTPVAAGMSSTSESSTSPSKESVSPSRRLASECSCSSSNVSCDDASFKATPDDMRSETQSQDISVVAAMRPIKPPPNLSSSDDEDDDASLDVPLDVPLATAIGATLDAPINAPSSARSSPRDSEILEEDWKGLAGANMKETRSMIKTKSSIFRPIQRDAVSATSKEGGGSRVPSKIDDLKKSAEPDGSKADMNLQVSLSPSTSSSGSSQHSGSKKLDGSKKSTESSDSSFYKTTRARENTISHFIEGLTGTSRDELQKLRSKSALLLDDGPQTAEERAEDTDEVEAMTKSKTRRAKPKPEPKPKLKLNKETPPKPVAEDEEEIHSHTFSNSSDDADVKESGRGRSASIMMTRKNDKDALAYKLVQKASQRRGSTVFDAGKDNKTVMTCLVEHPKNLHLPFYRRVFSKVGRHKNKYVEESTSDPMKVDQSISEGEIGCKSSISTGEIRKFDKDMAKSVKYLKKHPEHMLRKELGDKSLKVARQRTQYNNWVTYYLEKDEHKKRGRSPPCTNFFK